VFATWSAQMIIHPMISINDLTIYDPQVGLSYNLLIMSKLWSVAFGCGVYGFFFVYRIDRFTGVRSS